MKKSYDLVNLSNTILAHYGREPFHQTIPELQEALKGHRKIALFLFDGAGEAIFNKHPIASKYMLDNKFMTISSVNPATTVAATTSITTGLYPAETGFLGWTIQFDEYGGPIEPFRNRMAVTNIQLPPNTMERKCPITHMDKLLAEVGVNAKIMQQYPIKEDGPRDLKDGLIKATQFFKDGGEFLYFYWPDPDHLLHIFGTKSIQVSKCLFRLKKLIKKFRKQNPDVLCLSVADHGLIDIESCLDMADHQDLAVLLEKPVSIEGRTPCFFVKEGRKDDFKRLFNRYYGGHFKLLSKEEVFETKFFGEGNINPVLNEFVGDFIGVSLDRSILNNSNDYLGYEMKNTKKANHAGTDPDEMNICLSLYKPQN